MNSVGVLAACCCCAAAANTGPSAHAPSVLGDAASLVQQAWSSPLGDAANLGHMVSSLEHEVSMLGERLLEHVKHNAAVVDGARKAYAAETTGRYCPYLVYYYRKGMFFDTEDMDPEDKYPSQTGQIICRALTEGSCEYGEAKLDETSKYSTPTLTKGQVVMAKGKDGNGYVILKGTGTLSSSGFQPCFAGGQSVGSDGCQLVNKDAWDTPSCQMGI